MKKAIIFLSLAIAAATSYAKDIKEIVFTTVPEMECTSCENKIKGNLRFEKGIKDIETDITTQEIKITYDAARSIREGPGQDRLRGKGKGMQRRSRAHRMPKRQIGLLQRQRIRTRLQMT